MLVTASSAVLSGFPRLKLLRLAILREKDGRKQAGGLQHRAEHVSLFYLGERICFSEFWQVTSMTLKIVPARRFKITAVIILYIKCVGKAV